MQGMKNCHLTLGGNFYKIYDTFFKPSFLPRMNVMDKRLQFRLVYLFVIFVACIISKCTLSRISIAGIRAFDMCFMISHLAKIWIWFNENAKFHGAADQSVFIIIKTSFGRHFLTKFICLKSTNARHKLNFIWLLFSSFYFESKNKIIIKRFVLIAGIAFVCVVCACK